MTSRPAFLSDMYYTVADNNPATQVYSTASTAFVANSAAAFLTWLANFYGFAQPILGMGNNGSGLIRLTLQDTSPFLTGQRWQVEEQVGQAAATGTWQITVVNPTTIDLVGSTFNAGDPWVSGGLIKGAQKALTVAGIPQAISSAGGQVSRPPQGRLTLINNNPIMSINVVNAQFIYYLPYIGSLVPVYNGTNFQMMTIGTGIFCDKNDTTKNPGPLAAGKLNDWFFWMDGQIPRLGHGPDWTDILTRSAGTALVAVDGIWLNSVAITNGPAARRGTFLGTTYTLSAAGLAWVFGGLLTGGAPGQFHVWNAYNRVDVTSVVRDDTNSWTLTSPATRPANNSAAMRQEWVCGLAEDSFTATYSASAYTGSGFTGFGVGYDSTTAFSGSIGFFNSGGTPAIIPSFGTFATPPAIGFHTVTALETQGGVATTPSTIYGDANLPLQAQNGLLMQLRM